MNPTLRNLLAVALVAGGGIAVYSYKDAATTFVDLQNAGTGIGADCSPRLIVCHERLNPMLRARLVDAGFPPGPKKYARVVRQAFKCPSVDGGQPELVVPGFERFSVGNDGAETPDPNRCVDQPCTTYTGFCGNGPKNVRLATDAPACVRAPVGGPDTCLRAIPGEGTRFYGQGNVFSASEAAGSGCEPVGCTIFAGDSDTDL